MCTDIVLLDHTKKTKVIDDEKNPEWNEVGRLKILVIKITFRSLENLVNEN